MTLFLTSSPSGCPFEPARLFRYWTDATIFWRTCGPSGRITPCWALPLRQTPMLTPRTTRCAGYSCPELCERPPAPDRTYPLRRPQSGRDRLPAAPQRLCDAVRRPCAHPEPLFCPAGPAGAVPQLPRHRAGRERRQHERRPAGVCRARGTGRSRRPRTTAAG